MLLAYFDESYDHGIFALGGFLSWRSEWKGIEREWKKAVRANHVQRFHAADCNNARGEFVGWPQERRRGFVKRLIGILTKHQVYGVFSGAVLQDFNEFSGQSQDDSPYLLCFQHCVQEVAERTQKLPLEDRVDFVLDRTRFTGMVTETYRWMRFERDWEGRSRLGDLILASWKESVPLQCADLMAYEAFKMLRRGIIEPEREVRRSFLAISGSVPIYGGHFERDGLLRLLEAIGQKDLSVGKEQASM